MDFFAELEGERRAASAVKGSIPIGIFGSFWPRNRGLLERVRDRLLETGYRARLSLDLIDEFPKGEEEDDDSYNLRMSQTLLDRSRVHILVFFHEAETEHCINQSASMEFERLCETRGLENAIVLVEEGVFAQSGGYFRGRHAQTSREIRWEAFERDSDGTVIDEDDFHTLVRQFCLQRVHFLAQGFGNG